MRMAFAFPLLLSASLMAQAPAATKSFVVADVRASAFASNPFLHGNAVQGDRYFLTQATMVDLIATAYGLDAADIHGGPSWLERDRYDIRAKVPPGTTQADVKLMLRSLLADRFHLVAKTSTLPMPTYILSAGAGKPKLTPSEGSGEGKCDESIDPEDPGPKQPWYLVATCTNLTMAGLAETLHTSASGYLKKPVVDKTKIDGTWDFTLKWSDHGELQDQGADAITIFSAVEKQLGLKLELKTAPRSVFEVATVDRTPTPNAANINDALPEPPPAEFEVATIKPSAPNEEEFAGISGGKIETRALPLSFLVNFAWDLNPSDKESIANAPSWLNSEKFDIFAKPGANIRMDKLDMGTVIDYEDLRSMVRALIEERFQMKAHLEDRPVTAYTLVAVKPKLKPTADPTERTRCKEGPGPDGKDPRIDNPALNRLVTCQNMTIAQIGDELQRVANGYIFNSVIDATGLKGSYDFTLSFSSASTLAASSTAPSGSGAEASDPNGALSVFDAVSRQLGLKLEKTKHAYPVLVIDHIEKTPTAN